VKRNRGGRPSAHNFHDSRERVGNPSHSPHGLHDDASSFRNRARTSFTPMRCSVSASLSRRLFFKATICAEVGSLMISTSERTPYNTQRLNPCHSRTSLLCVV